MLLARNWSLILPSAHPKLRHAIKEGGQLAALFG